MLGSGALKVARSRPTFGGFGFSPLTLTGSTASTETSGVPAPRISLWNTAPVQAASV